MIALSTGTLYTFGIARVFGLTARAGFDAIEVLIDQRWDTRQGAYLRQLSSDHGLPIASMHNPFIPHISGYPSDPTEQLMATVRLAHELDVDTVVVHLPLRVGYVEIRGHERRVILPTLPSPYRRLRRWMEYELPGFETATGVRLCVENMPAHRFLGWRFNPCWWNTVKEWSRFPHLTLDTTHLGTWGLDPLVVYRQIKARVCHLHLSNFNGEEHRRLEDGPLRLAELLREMRADSYQGAIVVELDPSAIATDDEARLIEQLRAQLAFCRNHFPG
jgi:sugar phosphate isomerase/epimerase